MDVRFERMLVMDVVDAAEYLYLHPSPESVIAGLVPTLDLECTIRLAVVSALLGDAGVTQFVKSLCFRLRSERDLQIRGQLLTLLELVLRHNDRAVEALLFH